MSEPVIGIVQASYGVNPLDNAEKSYKLIKRGYAEADLIVLPEYSMLNPLAIGKPEKVYGLAEYLTNSKYISFFIRVAGEIGTNILIHFIEKTEKTPLSKSTAVLVTYRGEVVPVYSKIHLFDAYGYRESAFFEPGRGPGKIISINGVQLGFAICYDIRFPELFRTYALMGAQVIIVQAGWVKDPLKEEILDKLATARAHENGVYIVLANQTGEMFTGRSGVFNPWGYRELDLGSSERYFEYTINTEELRRVRESIPVLEQAREKWEIRLKG